MSPPGRELGGGGKGSGRFPKRNRPCLIEWKTSDRARPTLAHCFDFPIQAAAYAGAVNVDANYPFKVSLFR